MVVSCLASTLARAASTPSDVSCDAMFAVVAAAAWVGLTELLPEPEDCEGVLTEGIFRLGEFSVVVLVLTLGMYSGE